MRILCMVGKHDWQGGLQCHGCGIRHPYLTASDEEVTFKALALICKKAVATRNVEQLLLLLECQDPSRVRDAAQSLGDIGDHRAFQALLKTLEYANKKWSGSDDAQGAAAEALGKLGDPAAIDHLVRVLQRPKGERWKVKTGAAKALGKLCKPGDERPVPSLLDCLSSYGSTLSAPAARALGILGDPRAIAPLITRAQDRRPDMLRGAFAAADALAKLVDKGAVQALVTALSDESLTWGAVFALDRIQTDDPSVASPALDIWRKYDQKRSPELLRVIARTGGTARMEIVREGLTMPGEMAVATCRVVAEGGHAFDELRQDMQRAVEKQMDAVREESRNDGSKQAVDNDTIMRFTRLGSLTRPYLAELKQLMQDARLFWTSIWIAGALATIDDAPEPYVRFLLEVMHDADKGRPKHPEINPLLASIPQMKVRVLDVQSWQSSPGPGGLLGTAFGFVASHSRNSPWGAAANALSAAATARSDVIKGILLHFKNEYPKQVADVPLVDYD